MQNSIMCAPMYFDVMEMHVSSLRMAAKTLITNAYPDTSTHYTQTRITVLRVPVHKRISRKTSERILSTWPKTSKTNAVVPHVACNYYVLTYCQQKRLIAKGKHLDGLQLRIHWCADSFLSYLRLKKSEFYRLWNWTFAWQLSFNWNGQFC